MQICFFEDDRLDFFHPLTLTRPVDDLRLGIYTIAEKWQTALEVKNITRILRSELEGVFDKGEMDKMQSCLWINSRYLPSKELVGKVKDLSEGQCLKHNKTVIAAHVNGTESRDLHQKNEANFENLFVLETGDFLSLNYIWDLFQLNAHQIKADAATLNYGISDGADISHHAVLQNSDNIIIEYGAVIEPGCVLIADKGPIYIGKNARIMSDSHIRGPVAICEESTVKMGAKIYEDTTIGPVCKVGGDVSNVIFHSYSNKAHEGYMGNSLVGQWCNFGAGTITSNLKNNYGTINITNWNNHEEIKTGLQFLGTIMGDHSKTAINTQLNTGTVCGVSCNIFSNDFPPKFIPSFSWVGSNVIQTYKLDKAFNAMEAMMARRGKELTESHRNMLEHIYENRGPIR